MRPGRFAALVVLAVGLLQAAWILVLPPFGGIDEIDHAYRASAVAHGQATPGRFATDGRGRLVRADADLVKAAGPRCRTLKYVGPDNCDGVGEPRDGLLRVASSASSYNVGFYWVVGTVGRAFDGVGALYAMRAATAAIALALIGAGAWCLGLRRTAGWRGVGVFLALTPVAVYSTAVVAPNGPEIAAGFALWSALVGLAGRGSPGQERAALVVAGVAAVLLGNLRGLGPGFLVVTLVVAVVVAPTRFREVVVRHRRLVALLVLLAVAAIAQQLWFSHQMNALPGAPVTPDSRVGWSWALPLAWELGTIAVFPYRDQPAPFVVYPLYLAAFVTLLVLAVRRGPGRLRFGVVLLTVGVLVMPGVLTYVSYDTLGVIWQGRYGLALAVGVPLLASVALDSWRPRPRPALIGGLGVLLVVVDLACVLHVRALALGDPVSASDPNAATRSAALLVALVVAAGVVRALALGGPAGVRGREPA